MMQEPFFPPEVTGQAVKTTMTGGNRVYIEQHQGLLGYTEEEALFRTAEGTLRIAGHSLRFALYTASEAVVTGEIDQITLQGGSR